VEAAAVSYFGKDVPVPASAGIRAAPRTRNILSGDASGSRRARGLLYSTKHTPAHLIVSRLVLADTGADVRAKSGEPT